MKAFIDTFYPVQVSYSLEVYFNEELPDGGIKGDVLSSTDTSHREFFLYTYFEEAGFLFLLPALFCLPPYIIWKIFVQLPRRIMHQKEGIQD